VHSLLRDVAFLVKEEMARQAHEVRAAVTTLVGESERPIPVAAHPEVMMDTRQQLRLAHDVLDEVADLVTSHPTAAYRDPVPGAERTITSSAAVRVGTRVVQPFVSPHIPGSLLALLDAGVADPWRDAVFVDLDQGGQRVTFLEQTRSGAMRTLVERAVPRRYDEDNEPLPAAVCLAQELIAFVRRLEDAAA